MTYVIERCLRLPQVLEIVPVSRATWYAGVKSGRYPAPIKLGLRAVAWQLSDIEKLIDSLSSSSKLNLQ
jgi:prophage regulatory protein